MKATVFVLGLLFAVHGTLSSRILFIQTSPSVSHAFPINKVIESLLRRGHHVTHISADLLETNHANYSTVSTRESYKFVEDFNISTMADTWPMLLAEAYHEEGITMCHLQFNLPQMKEWLKKDEKFDLVVTERLPFQCYYGLVHRAGRPPLVGIVTLPAMMPSHYTIGNPTNPAYLPDVFVGLPDRMTFWQRLYNTYHYLRFMHYWFYTVLPEHEAVMRQYFGPDPPSVFETERNFSLLIVTAHFSSHYPRPNLPNVIELTGLHVETDTKPLPQELQEFLDGAKHGAIYFSLGTNVRSSTLPPHTVQAFLEAFRELPQRIVWKWENGSLPWKPDNVLVGKWFPQQDILAHPNVKLYIMQGGLQSINEAAYRAIPLIAIPFFSDQTHNAAKIDFSGIGLRLCLKDITKESVLRSVQTVLGNPKYRENMKQYSILFREHRQHSVETAVWWLEYVIRHNGAPHLRSAAVDLYWWQLLLLDVIGFLLLVVGFAVAVVYFGTRKLIKALTSKKHVKTKKQ
ncbi:UDP-glucosyltransferase 2-like isoform X1 [Schistocerca serialis cubense]|uniref:UDP-glucosyltransferase 2-like isoform X1 n=1 Tax=Schistocerca serialis cubense TaxID=2023355 RepID=UPI00214E02BF|nr:UDP-glucosyltransferase 2-like isoform X1 [Schistocerca serialis cubense]